MATSIQPLGNKPIQDTSRFLVYVNPVQFTIAVRENEQTWYRELQDGITEKLGILMTTKLEMLRDELIDDNLCGA